jgi:hypothetical protein
MAAGAAERRSIGARFAAAPDLECGDRILADDGHGAAFDRQWLTSAAMYSGERPKRSHLSTSAPALIARQTEMQIEQRHVERGWIQSSDGIGPSRDQVPRALDTALASRIEQG